MSGRGQIRDGSVDAGVGGARPFEPSRARDSWDPAIAALAAAQHGVVSRAQLRAIGLTAAAVRHRVRRRRLIEVHRQQDEARLLLVRGVPRARRGARGCLHVRHAPAGAEGVREARQRMA